MTADSIRGRLDGGLATAHISDKQADEVIDLLLPVVERAIAAGRAEALAPVLALADELDRQALDMELVRADAVAVKPADPATAYADRVAYHVGKEWVKIAERIRVALSETSDTTGAGR